MEKIGPYTAIVIVLAILAVSVFLVQWEVGQNEKPRKKKGRKTKK